MLDLQRELREITSKSEVIDSMKNKDLKSIEINVVVKSPDSEIATLFDILEEDLSDFFFGCKVNILTEHQLDYAKNRLARNLKIPIKTISYVPNKELSKKVSPEFGEIMI